jgi:hypothetical protein
MATVSKFPRQKPNIKILFSYIFIQTYASLLAKGCLTKELFVLKIAFSTLSLKVDFKYYFYKVLILILKGLVECPCVATGY